MDELKEYIRNCRELGFSDRDIRLNLESYYYPKSLVRKAFFSLDAQRHIETAMLFGILITLAIGIIMLGPAKTGYVAYQNISQYYDNTQWNSSMNSTFYWIPEHNGLLSSLQLSGRIAGEGHADIYLIAGGRRYLVSSLPESGISGITGHVIDQPEVNASANLTEMPDNESLPEDIDLLNQSADAGLDTALPEVTENISEPSANISIGSNITSEINSNITNISTNLSPDISNVTGNITDIALNTSSNISSDINESLPVNITIPEQNVTAGNLTINQTAENRTAENITIPTPVNVTQENITQNATEELSFIDFTRQCIDTCTLPELNYSGYSIEIVGENLTVFIDSISYTITDYIQSINESINISENITGNLSNITANVTLNITQNMTENVSVDLAMNSTANHTGIEINRPVRWTSSVSAGKKLVMSRHAYNITIAESKARIMTRNANVSVDEYNRFRESEMLQKELADLQSPVDSADAEEAYSKLQDMDSKISQGKNKTRAIETDDTVVLYLEDEAIVSENISNMSNSTVSASAAMVEYYTPAPEAREEKYGRYRKQVTVSSEDGLHYDNILAYTSLDTEARPQDISIYWLNKGGQRLPVQQSWFRDTDSNGLIDRVEWIVPHLSNETYEISITVLNVQSYPIVGDTWTVAFTTTGTADLTIEAVNGTAYGSDLEFVSLKCDGTDIPGAWDSANDRVMVRDYSCNGTGYHTVRVLTKGVHNQLFTFGGVQAYAHNLAGLLPKTMNIQGKLTNSTNGLINTTVSMTFRLYDVFTGGSALWTETQSVNVSNGIYDAILGNVNPITLNFSKPYYLGIQVGADSEMVPRINITQSPYSFNSFIAQEALNVTCLNCITGTQVDESTLSGVNADTLDSVDSSGFCQTSGVGCPVSAQGNPSPWTNNSIEIFPATTYPNKMNISEIRLNGSVLVRDGTTLIIRG